MSERIKELFRKHSDEFLEFKKIPEDQRLSKRPDLHAFILLDQIFPDDGRGIDMVCAAWHDEIALTPKTEDIKDASEDQIIQLIRCGVRLDDDYLVMFV